jgi:hypothetical protein
VEKYAIKVKIVLFWNFVAYKNKILQEKKSFLEGFEFIS